MKFTTILLLIISINTSFAQKRETIAIPKGIVYNYCDSKTIEKAKQLITDNLSNSGNYEILQNLLIVGPELWKRFKDYKKIQLIEKGNVQFHVDDLILEGKMSQDINDSKIIWDEFKNEVSQDFKIRKANENELKYYWSVISFDIDEPLLIIETKEHNYILNLLKKDLKLMWLDEAPKPHAQETIQDNGMVKYQKGKEITSISEGMKETKLEKVVLLSSDEELKENTSVEDLGAIIKKTDKIFESLFKDSKKSGKIMIEFELKKDKNEITFAVKDNLDLEIMKEFEKKVNGEKYPNSKKDSIKLQLIYKVNSFNDTE
jgi:RNAse (barnase) inhibitor barstar